MQPGVCLIGALITYCELGSLVRGLPPAGLRSSGRWALQTALPWIVIGAVFGRLRSRLLGNGGDVIKSGLSMAAVVLGIAAFALLGETLVRTLTGAPDVFAFFCERAPASVAVSSLLVAIYVGSRSRQWEREWTQSATPAHPERLSAAAVAPPKSGVSEWLEVMTEPVAR